MNYRNFDVWQFVEDRYFVDWVLNPDIHSREFWESFLSEHPEKVQDVMLAKEMVSGMKYKREPEMEGAAYVALFERVLASKRKIKFSNSQRRKSVMLMNVYKYAAAAVFLVGIFAIWNVFHPFSKKETLTLKTVECPVGSHVTTLLSDGTRVKLNSGSKISFKESFTNDSARIVNLEGEAYFDVTKDASRPFIVKSNYIETRVLGTSFNIRAYPQDGEVSVAVAEGKVKVNSTKQVKEEAFEYVVLPMQESVYHVATAHSEQRRLKDESVFDWMNWKLVCKDESLSEILKKLERWYGIQFRMKDPIDMTETFTGVFENESAIVILEALESQRALRFEVKSNREILIYKYN